MSPRGTKTLSVLFTTVSLMLQTLLLILINEFRPSKFADMKLSFLNSNSLCYYCSSYLSFLAFAVSLMICFKYVFIFLMIMKDVIFCTCIFFLEFFIQFHNFKHHLHTNNYKHSSTGPNFPQNT